MNDILQDLLPAFNRHQDFVLTTHMNPDGDGIGSELALAEWLVSRGRDVRIVNCSSTPQVYRFLDPDGRIELYDAARHDTVIRRAAAIVVLDTNHPDRLGEMRAAVLGSPAVKICIDHHLDPAPFASTYFLDEDATSTGELIYRLLASQPGCTLTSAIATPLYCAIMTDTGSFRYPRVDTETHEIIARLIACGADPVAVYHEVYEQWTAGRIQLLGETLAALETAYDGRLASVCITRAMLCRTGTTEEDTDNFTTYPMSIRGVHAGILFLEVADGVKVSFRSRGDIPINELAREFGGNGHKNAAGARVHGGNLDEVRRRVVAAAARFLPPTLPHEERAG